MTFEPVVEVATEEVVAQEGVEGCVCQMSHDQAASPIPWRRSFPIAASLMQRPPERCSALIFVVVLGGPRMRGRMGMGQCHMY